MYMNEQLFDRPARSKVTSQSVRPSGGHSNSRLSRLLVLLTAVAIVLVYSLCAPMLGGDQDALAASSGHLKSSIEIEAGDTLWKIANEHSPKGRDVRDYIHEIKVMNGLKSNLLVEGQVLQLP